MLDIKRILMIIMVICYVNIAHAESCIMITDMDITDIKCDNHGVIDVKLLTTLSNEKRTIIVSSLKDGDAGFSVKLKNKYYDYKVSVTGGKLKINGDTKIKILPVDLPSEVLPPEGSCQ